MPPRTVPTARQRRLGAELRRMRENAGLSVTEAGEELGTGRTRISNIEAGRFGVSAERVRTFAGAYACPDLAYVDALATMADERGKGWWEDYRDELGAGLLDLAELEHYAVKLRSFQIVHIPGLLQTEEYANAVFATAVPQLSALERRRRLSHRMKRRDVLDRANAPECTFLVHESVTRVSFGGPQVMRAQLEYLVEASERGNIAVRIIPFSAGGFPYMGSSVLYVTGAVPQLDTVQTDVAGGTAFMDAQSHLANYRCILDRTEDMSLSPAASRDFLRRVIHQL